MSCADTPLTAWIILALLIVVAALWGGLELVMWKRAIRERYEARANSAYRFAALTVQIAEKALRKEIKSCD